MKDIVISQTPPAIDKLWLKQTNDGITLNIMLNGVWTNLLSNISKELDTDLLEIKREVAKLDERLEFLTKDAPENLDTLKEIADKIGDFNFDEIEMIADKVSFESDNTNLSSASTVKDAIELIANKAKPKSFHYEVVGESYDFAKDKPNMYFRQEALKALWQYNGCDIEYNNNFLKIQPRQNAKSADLPHVYYARQDKINEVEDSYVDATAPTGSDYRHLSGAEIVYYPLRQEYRVWNHAMAVDLDDQVDTTNSAFGGRGLIASNMRYQEDRWRIQINPLLVTYKNEYKRPNNYTSGILITPNNSTWTYAADGITRLPKLSIYNSPIPNDIISKGTIDMPNEETPDGSDNALCGLYAKDVFYLDTSRWLDDSNIYNTNFGAAQNRKETDMRDKFIKIRIRYSGKELAVIDYLNTIYQVSYI